MALSTPRLIAITDVARFGVARTLEAFARLCKAAVPQSVCVQLRLEDVPAGEWLELGRQLQEICAESEQEFCINERLDVALVLGARRVHLKAKSVAAALVQELWQRRHLTVWVSQAWHPTEQSPPVGVDALVISPAFAPRKGRPALGATQLADWARVVSPTPVFALGGIDVRNVGQLVTLGTCGVAAIGACYDSSEGLLESLTIIR